MPFDRLLVLQLSARAYPIAITKHGGTLHMLSERKVSAAEA